VAAEEERHTQTEKMCAYITRVRQRRTPGPFVALALYSALHILQRERDRDREREKNASTEDFEVEAVEIGGGVQVLQEATRRADQYVHSRYHCSDSALDVHQQLQYKF
jgi:hypothetical protein